MISLKFLNDRLAWIALFVLGALVIVIQSGTLTFASQNANNTSKIFYPASCSAITTPDQSKNQLLNCATFGIHTEDLDTFKNLSLLLSYTEESGKSTEYTNHETELSELTTETSQFISPSDKKTEDEIIQNSSEDNAIKLWLGMTGEENQIEIGSIDVRLIKNAVQTIDIDPSYSSLIKNPENIYITIDVPKELLSSISLSLKTSENIASNKQENAEITLNDVDLVSEDKVDDSHNTTLAVTWDELIKRIGSSNQVKEEPSLESLIKKEEPLIETPNSTVPVESDSKSTDDLPKDVDSAEPINKELPHEGISPVEPIIELPPEQDLDGTAPETSLPPTAETTPETNSNDSSQEYVQTSQTVSPETNVTPDQSTTDNIQSLETENPQGNTSSAVTDEAVSLLSSFSRALFSFAQNIIKTTTAFAGLVSSEDFPQIVKSEIIDPLGNHYIINVTKNSDGSLSYDDSAFRHEFTPGVYEISITLFDGVSTYEFTDTWSKGVLALNYDKSTYVKNSDVYLQMADLSRTGNTKCNAVLSLAVTDPDQEITTYSTNRGTITTSSTCGANNVTSIPDYFTTLHVTKNGVYHLVLTDDNDHSSLSRDIKVTDSNQFVIQRTASTRINPFLATYDVKLEVTSEQNFTGTLQELVPKDFVITHTAGASISEQDNQKTIVWPITLTAKTPYQVTYSYQAPKVSPYRYILGSTAIYSIDDSSTSLTEPFLWQLASDNLGDVSVYKQNASGAQVTTSGIDAGWDMPLMQSASIEQQADNSIRLIDPGHYLVMYSEGIDSTGADPSELQSSLRVVGSDIGYGHSSCYISALDSNSKCFLSASTILETTSSDTDVSLLLTKSDTGSSTNSRLGAQSQASFIHLKDNWDYARMRDSIGHQAINSDTFVPINWDMVDELDSNSYTHSGNDLVLKKIGHYLVTTQVAFSESNTSRIPLQMQITIGGVEVPGSLMVATISGANGATHQTATYQGIILNEIENQTLQVEVRCAGITCQDVSTEAFGSSLSLVKLPDTADYIRLTGSANTPVDVTTGEFPWSNDLEVDSGSFRRDSGTPGAIYANHGTGNEDYLFFGGFFADKKGTSLNSIQNPTWKWRNTGGYIRRFDGLMYGSDGGATMAGSSGGTIFGSVSPTDTFEITSTNESRGTDQLGQFIGGMYAVQGVNISSLLADISEFVQTHYRFRPPNLHATDQAEGINSDHFGADIDTNLTSLIEQGDTERLRIQIANTGAVNDADTHDYALQYGKKITSCNQITNWSSIGETPTSPFGFSHDVGYSDHDSTTQLLPNNGFVFQSGEGILSQSTIRDQQSLAQNSLTELEYAFSPTSFVEKGVTYCFRVVDTVNGVPKEMSLYAHYPEIQISSPRLVQKHSRIRSYNATSTVLNANDVSDWTANLDKAPNVFLNKGDSTRIRFEVTNSGALESEATDLQLQYAKKQNTCEASTDWSSVDTPNNAFEMNNSTGIHSDLLTTAIFPNTESLTPFAPGFGSDTSDTIHLGVLPVGGYSELEYSLASTSVAQTGESYCFRLFNKTLSTPLDQYESYPIIEMQGGPRVEHYTGTITGTLSTTLPIEPELASTQNAFLFMDSTGGSNTDDTPSKATCSAYISSTSTITVEKSSPLGVCSYSIQLVEARNGEFKVRGRGAIDLGGLNLTATGDADNLNPITKTDKTMVLSNFRSDGTSTGDWNASYATVALSDEHTVTATRYLNMNANTVIRYEVVEWLYPGITVETGEENLSGSYTDSNRDIKLLDTVVNFTSSFSFITSRHASSTPDAMEIIAHLTPAQIEFYRGTDRPYNSVVRWWVVGLPNGTVSVQKNNLNGTYGGDNSQIPIMLPNEVNPDRSAVLSNHSTDISGDIFPQGLYTTSLTSNSTLAMSSGRAGGVDNFDWQVIDFKNWLPFTIAQTDYQWYRGIDELTPTSEAASPNSQFAGAQPGNVFHLRLGLSAFGGDYPKSIDTFQLQYANKIGGSCSTSTGWKDLGIEGSTDEWTQYDYPLTEDGSDLVTALLSDSNITESYSENGMTPLSPQNILMNTTGEWDFTVKNNAAEQDTTYCFRLISTSGKALDYSIYPEITTSLPKLSYVLDAHDVTFGSLVPSEAKFASQQDGTTKETAAGTLSVSTNAAGGYRVFMKATPLKNEHGDTIPGIGNQPTDPEPDTNQFGTKVLSTGSGARLSSAFKTGKFALDDSGTANTMASGSGNMIAHTYSLRYLAQINSLIPAGVYTSSIVYTVSGEF